MLDELFKTRGPVAQLGQSDREIVEAHNLLVPGSNPGGPTHLIRVSAFHVYYQLLLSHCDARPLQAQPHHSLGKLQEMFLEVFH
jgi:hypothetical protein